MKQLIRIISAVIILLSSEFLNAQPPQGINYQAVIRDGSGDILKNTNVVLRFSIKQNSSSGTVVYQETQNNTTNEYGLVSTVIGGGIPSTGTFADIEWSSFMHFLQVEVDAGDGFTDLGTNRFESVPYALNTTGSVWNQSGDNIYNSNDGNVGIGTANPAKKLDVIGDARINGLTVGRGGGNNSNSAYGVDALSVNGGNTNSAFGKDAMKVNSNGYDNVAFGVSALIQNTTGWANTAFGVRSLESNVTGDGLTAIGQIADVLSPDLSNAIAIGNYTYVDASNKARIGNGSMSSIGGQVQWTSFSDDRVKDNIQDNVIGLEFIKALHPVTFHYNVDKQNEVMGISEKATWEGKYDIEKIAFSGFIAQEVETAAQEVGYDFSGIDKSANVLGLRYSEFTVPLVKAVQEQQDQIEVLQNQIKSLQAEIEMLKKETSR